MDGLRCATPQHADEPGLSRGSWIILAAVLTGLGLALFGPVLFSWYSSDDFIHYASIIEGALPFVPAQPDGGFLRPLVGIGFWLDYHLWGLNPFPAHLFNILLHVANCLLVVKFAMVLSRVRARQEVFAPVMAGLVFLLLGCHAEPVSWISSRGDLLATFFTLLMLISFCRALQTASSSHWVASLSCLALALLSKESAFAAPLLAALCLTLFRPSVLWRSRKPLAAHLVLVAAYFLMRKWMIGGFVGGYGVRGHLRYHPDLIAQSLGHFSWRIFLPPLPANLWESAPAMNGALALAFLGALAIPVFLSVARGPLRRTPLLFCYLAFFVALTPVANIRIYLENTEGERYLYLASVFAALGSAHVLALIPRPGLRWGMVTFFALVQCVILVSGVLGWREAATIARRVVSDLQSQHQHGGMVLVNKPDACGGALVYRTGLPEALRYFGTSPIQNCDISVLFAVGLPLDGQGFRLESEATGEREILVLSATDSRAEISEEDQREQIEVLHHTRSQATFRFRAPLREKELFYYDSLAVKAFSDAATLGPLHSLP